jgi:thienamycin biosynthesis protein ThnO
MTSATSVLDVSSAAGTRILECLCSGEPFRTHDAYDVGPALRPIARASRAPRPLQWEMIQRASAAAAALRQVPNAEWLELFADVGKAFASGDDGIECAELTSRASGLPRARVLKAFAALSSDLARMGAILEAQVPGGDAETFYRCTRDPGRRWMSAPRGRHLAVRVPGNFPTINITWLISLAARRPVLLCTSLLDPFSTHRLVAAFHAAGLPNGAISLCHQDAPVWWERADQVLMSGDWPAACRRGPSELRTYHHGRSKLVVVGECPSDEVMARVALQVVQGCGRLCTNISAVLTDGNAERLAERLAAHLSAFEVRPLDDPRACVPCFPQRRVAEAIAAQIEAAVRRGARDLTSECTGAPLRAERWDELFLRPTVLWVDVDDPIFGCEFPFPFVAVAQARPYEFLQRSRGSLVVALLGASAQLFDEFALDPSIDKVFAGDDFDRGYDPAEPHEGWLTDFLFTKKVTSDVH